MNLKRGRGRRLVEYMLALLVAMALLLSDGAWEAALAMGAQAAAASLATTAVTDTIYRGDGTPASGTVLLSWPGFTTAGGESVPAGSEAVTIGTNGVLNAALVPNAGSTPMGSYYTAVYHLDDGTVQREYWVVPVSQYAVKVSAIRSTVLPASVAMQTVSKNYVDTQISIALTGHPLDSSPYVLKSGDTMTGPLVLPGDPTAPQQAADKNYVDAQTAAVQGGLGQKVSTMPQGTQTVVQPTGTQLEVNKLNGAQYASQNQSGAGNDGIANTVASPDCVGGCDVVAEQTYGTAEVAPAAASLPNKTHLEDLRGGARTETFTNPLDGQNGTPGAADTINETMTQPIAEAAAATGSSIIAATNLVLNQTALTGGSNEYPSQVQGTVPYFKSTYSALQLNGVNNTPGQHVLAGDSQNCYGVGDCILNSFYMSSSGGIRDNADEGAHPFDIVVGEDTAVFTGTCATGCTVGATTLQVATAGGQGTQGEGRYLIDKNPAGVITAGTLTGGSSQGRQPSATFAGTNFPVSAFLETAQTVPTQSNQIAPGTVSVPIATSGVPAGFASSTAALPATAGVACVVDPQESDNRPSNFETAPYTVVDGSHVQLTLRRPHAVGATIAVGGLCGYGLEQLVDTTNGLRQVFPVIGSTSATGLLYAGNETPLAGQTGLQSGYTDMSFVVAAIARTGGVVTVTTANNFSADVNGLTLTVGGVADTSYNGSFVVTTTGPNTLTYADGGPDSTSTGGTLNVVTGSFALYPMAEAVSVFDQTAKAVDGQFTLAANTVNWVAGDAVEEPHYFQQNVHLDLQQATQFLPRPVSAETAGVQYNGVNSLGLTGWFINNASPVTNYYGNGGTHVVPDSGLSIAGAWRDSILMEPGDEAAVKLQCNSHGCDKWNSGYDLFQMQTSAGVDRQAYSPATSRLVFELRGTNYTFDPNSFTAGTINVGALNATTVNGKFIGTVAAASLPVFGASGASHAQGAVPDPGNSAGATRFLREDGAWAAVGANNSSNGAGTGGASSLSTLTTTGPINMPKRASLLGEYLLNEGAGAVAHDTSGNGNDGAITGAAWEGTADLDFNDVHEFVQLPTALNGAQAWQFALYLPPFYNDGVPSPAPGVLGPGSMPFYPAILCGTDRAHLCLLANSKLNTRWLTRFDAYSTDATESGEALTAGWHVFTLLCGSNVNGVVTKTRYLFDGVEVSTYVHQGDAGTCPAVTGGNYQIGGSDIYGDSSWFHGKVAAAWAWNAQLSLQDGVAAAKSALDYMKQKGVETEFGKLPHAAPLVLAGMDSRTFGEGLTSSTVWPATMQLSDPSYTVTDLGISGAQVSDLCPQFDLLYGSHMGAQSGPVILALWGGVNDIQLGAQGARDIANSLHCMVAKGKAAGARVVLATEISSESNVNATGDTIKNALDTIIRQEAFGWGADNIADLATDPHLGADGASNNTSCFGDNLHPGPNCEPYVTTIMQDAINELLGSRETNRHMTAAASYVETAGDRFLDLTGASAQTVSLPVCTGYTLKREVVNLGTGAAAVTADGLVGAAAVAPGSRGVYVPIPGPLSTGGCHWERTE